MITIKKVLNTSVVLVEDDNLQEFIMLSKGIGYGRKNGDTIDTPIDKQLFIPVDNLKERQYIEILENIPYDLLNVTKLITDEARLYLGKSMNDSLYFVLADHIAFAIERQKNNLHIMNRVFWEIKSFYPDEFEVGLKGIALIKQHLDIELPEQEAANIAFHIVNAQVGDVDGFDSAKTAKLIGEIMNIIQYSLGKPLDKRNVHYIRLVIHIKFFAERFFTNSMLNNTDTSLYLQLKKQYQQELGIVEKIEQFIVGKYHVSISEEELSFLMVHIHRINRIES